MRGGLVFMEVTAARQLSSRTDSTVSTSPRVLKRQAAVDERSVAAMDRRKSSADQSASTGYFKRSPKQIRRESEDMSSMGRKQSVDTGPSGRKTSVDTGASGRRQSVVETMLERRKSSAAEPCSVSMYFKRSPTTMRRESEDVGAGRKSSVDTSSRRMSTEPSDRRKGSTETSVSSYFKRSPLTSRRESDDLITRKSSVDNSRKTSVDTACTVIYRPATITEDSNVAVTATSNGEIHEHDGDTADSEKDAPRGGGGRGQRDEKGGGERRHVDERTHETSRDLGTGTRGTEDRETDTELDRRFMLEARDGRGRRSHEFGDRLTVRDASRRKVSGTSRSSMSSIDSDAYNTMVNMPKRWTVLETVGRCMLLFSVAFFIVGVLITVFGFSNTGINKSQQLPLQVLGPTCLTMTVVMWVVWYVITRLGSLEWKRTQQAIELRDRVQLHAMAMDILKYPVITPGMLQNPDFRRQLMMKMRHKVLDLSSEYSESRRSSRACSEASKRRYSNVQYEKLFQQDSERKRSRTSVDGKPSVPFELPGIQISRIETLDFGSDGRASICSRSTRSRGSSYILIPSDMASDFSRLSCPSDYSLAGSRSSRSRGSRASSNLSSRMWDFSPRESDWDADISLGSRESQLSVLRQDWGGGPMDSTDCLSPHMPRRLSVVTFDMGSPTLRRHSSPVCPTRRKDTHTECTCGREGYPSIMRNRDMSCHSLRFSDGIRIVESTAARKRSADLVSCRSLRIDEDEREALHEAMFANSSGPKQPQTTSTSTSTQAEASVSTTTTTSSDPAVGGGNIAGGGVSTGSGGGGQKTERFGRPPLKRNNTDDSEVERRVARLFKEIEYSVSESVDDSKIHSFSSDFDYFGAKQQKVEAKEAQTQTMSETEIKMYEMGEYDLSYCDDRSSSTGTGRATKTESWNESLGRESHDSHSSEQTCYGNEAGEKMPPGGTSKSNANTSTKKKKSRSFEKTLSTISNALSSLGRRSNSSASSAERDHHHSREQQHPRHPAQRGKPIPTNIVTQGLSLDKNDEQEFPIKSPPPTYEDVVNKNL